VDFHGQLRHVKYLREGHVVGTVVGVNALAPRAESFDEVIAEMSRRNVESTLAACDEFRRWHRANFILKPPTPEQVAEHARIIRLLLMTVRWLQATLADPGSCAKDLLPRVDTMILLLEDCWQSVHETLDGTEAEKLLAQVFPE
jgi:hypothetical protein